MVSRSYLFFPRQWPKSQSGFLLAHWAQFVNFGTYARTGMAAYGTGNSAFMGVEHGSYLFFIQENGHFGSICFLGSEQDNRQNLIQC